MSDTTLAPAACPECQATVTDFRGRRWCPRCEWNLGEFDPERHDRPFGWRWLDRWAYRTAYRLNARQFSVVARSGARRAPGPTRLLLATISLLLFAGVAATLIGGAVLIVRDFPSLTMIPGALLMLIAFALRPRFGKLDPLLDLVTRDQAPTLFSLIDRVAAAVGAPRPRLVVVDGGFTAAAGAVGLRRRRLLQIGLSMWAALPPQQRVALLAHELGHFANRDIRRSLLTQPAFATLGTMAVLTSPDPDEVDNAEGIAAWLIALFSYAVMWPISRALWSAHLLLVWLGLRDGQRAEYLADDWMIRIAGSAGAGGFLDSLVTADAIAMMVGRAARAGGDATAWRAAAENARQAVAADLSTRRQLSIQEGTSLFASHPPSGLRRRRVDHQPWCDPQVVLTQQESDRIDAELARHYTRIRRSVAAHGTSEL
jgi:heat shock protein HtpX